MPDCSRAVSFRLSIFNRFICTNFVYIYIQIRNGYVSRPVEFSYIGILLDLFEKCSNPRLASSMTPQATLVG